MDTSTKPLDQLIALDARGRRHVVDLSTEEDRREYWRAVSFRVANTQLLIDEHSAAELLTLPEITVIPGTKHWVAGVANVRGELLPIVNFGDFISGDPVKPAKQTRVLVVVHEDVKSGLIVDQVYGIRRFPVDTLQGSRPDALAEIMKIMVTGCYEEEHLFHIMDVKKLVDESEFMQAAA